MQAKIQISQIAQCRIISIYFLLGYIGILFEMFFQFIDSTLNVRAIFITETLFTSLYSIVSLIFTPFTLIYYHSLPSQLFDNNHPVLDSGLFMSMSFLIGIVLILAFENLRRMLLSTLLAQKSRTQVYKHVYRIALFLGIVCIIIATTELLQGTIATGLTLGVILSSIMTPLTGVSALPSILLIMTVITGTILKKSGSIKDELDKII